MQIHRLTRVCFFFASWSRIVFHIRFGESRFTNNAIIITS